MFSNTTFHLGPDSYAHLASIIINQKLYLLVEIVRLLGRNVFQIQDSILDVWIFYSVALVPTIGPYETDIII